MTATVPKILYANIATVPYSPHSLVVEIKVEKTERAIGLLTLDGGLNTTSSFPADCIFINCLDAESALNGFCAKQQYDYQSSLDLSGGDFVRLVRNKDYSPVPLVLSLKDINEVLESM